MAFELPDGKTARNLQEQVAFLTGKVKELIAFINQAGLKSIQIVEELPEVGDPTVLYLLAKEDSNEGDYYDEYLWIDDAWELIGTTQIDLSDYCTLSTDQTITGVKTLKSDTSTTYLYLQNSYTTGYFRLEGYWFQIDKNLGARNISPITNNNYDLGSSTAAWKDLYLSGNIDLSNNVKLNSNAYSGFQVQIGGNNIFTVYAGYTLLNNTWPAVNNAYDLGSSGNKWKDLYLSGSIQTAGIKDSSGNTRVSIDGGDTTFVSNITPSSDNARSLGYASYRWKNAYFSGNISDGTYSSTVENLVKKARLYKHKITTSGGNVINVITPTASAFTDFNPAMIDDCIIAKVGSSTILSYNYNGGQMSDLYYVNYTGTQTSLSLSGQTITTDEISDI